ncbi:ABC transporter ATP-binding protein [Kutzneria albida]|uniref:Phosphonate C-P lyase system protein PhnK n=1 Tax=Kutzneria albida DSM 43870 TaxID=1449976 RepID=W5W1P5_9PSEU|nr:ABC transporter ATP-binding protein [Kutzneria albida]AHH94690.1 phosphonate C-P lyase system protein PhnK [Kutzneria albida DSM 43870]
MRNATLSVADVQKAYGSRQVLERVDFTLSAGELAGIVGENGAGKSTLLRILAGELKPDHGWVIQRGLLGYCPQQTVLNDALTVQQHLRYFQQAYQLPELTRAEELVERLGYGQYRKTRVRALSGGTRQKLNLTIALMHDPAIVLLDEPYQGFDWETYLHFWELAAELRDQGRSLLVISHLSHDIERLDTAYRLAGGVVKPMVLETT